MKLLQRLKRVDMSYLVAGILVGVGALLFFFAAGVSWLQGAGGVIIGTGFTVLITTIIGKQAIHEQYAREANLRRKDTLYGPLYAEIKLLREALELTLDGRGAFPQHIFVAGSSLSQASVTPVRRYTFNLALWPTYKKAYYLSDFTESARQLFDNVTEAAQTYNDAVERVKDPTVEILSQIIEDAILRTKSSQEYQEWHTKYPSETAWNDASARGETIPTWYRRLDIKPAGDSTIGHAWANSWIYSWPIQQEPETIGYLLSGDVQRASSTTHRGYMSGGDPPPHWNGLKTYLRAPNHSCMRTSATKMHG